MRAVLLSAVLLSACGNGATSAPNPLADFPGFAKEPKYDRDVVAPTRPLSMAENLCKSDEVGLSTLTCRFQLAENATFVLELDDAFGRFDRACHDGVKVLTDR